MGTSTTRNAERQSSSGLIESEDDDPGIRGLSSSSTSSKQHRNNSQSKHKPATDPLDAAIIDQSEFYSGSAALKLDQFVLGKTELAPEIAQGSLCPSSHSALSSLKGVAEASHARPDYKRSEARDVPQPAKDLASSPGALTWSSSSVTSASTGGTTESEEDAASLCFRDAFYSMPIKAMIRRVCVAGLEPKSRNTKTFCLSTTEIRDICKFAHARFASEPALLRLDAPVRVVGDLHGQFRDLMRLFKKGGMPPSQHYLFLGDYVDRGKQSLETIMLLLLLKLRYPSHVHILRGNHECAGVTKVYGFYDECKRRSSLKAWRAVVDVFNTLPIAAIVGERIFCVHGGISPSLSSLSQIDAIQRPTDVPESGILADLLWSDPDPQVKEWSPNDRGVSFCFGQRSLEKFCKQHGIDLVVRGHMVVEDGYEFFAGRRLVTVFSAPNYCGDFDNYGAMLSISADLVCSFDVIEPKSKTRSEAGQDKNASPTYHELGKQKSHGHHGKTSAVYA